MKKITIFLILIVIAITPLFAADTVANKTVTVSVTGALAESQNYDIGFSLSPVTEWAVEPSLIEDQKDPEYLNGFPLENGTDELGNNIGQNGAGSLYLYWRLVTTKTIELYLSIPAHMEFIPEPKKEPGAGLPWHLTFEYTDENDIKTTKTIDSPSGDVLARRITGFLTLKAVANNVELKVTTDSLDGRRIDGYYKGHIKLTIKAIG